MEETFLLYQGGLTLKKFESLINLNKILFLILYRIKVISWTKSKKKDLGLEKIDFRNNSVSFIFTIDSNNLTFNSFILLKNPWKK